MSQAVTFREMEAYHEKMNPRPSALPLEGENDEKTKQNSEFAFAEP